MKGAKSMTEKQAARLVKWVEDHGHTTDEAYQALAYVMKAESKGKAKKKEAPTLTKQ